MRAQEETREVSESRDLKENSFSQYWINDAAIEEFYRAMLIRMKTYTNSRQGHPVKAFNLGCFVFDKKFRISFECADKRSRDIVVESIAGKKGLEEFEEMLRERNYTPDELAVKELNYSLCLHNSFQTDEFQLEKQKLFESLASIDEDGSLRAILDAEIGQYIAIDKDSEIKFLRGCSGPDFFRQMRLDAVREDVAKYVSKLPSETAYALGFRVGDKKTNAELLDEAGIDESEVPEEMLCPFTQKIMDDPVIDPTVLTENNKNIATVPRLDRASLIRSQINSNFLSPYTRCDLPISAIVPDRVLKLRIEEFVERKLIEKLESDGRKLAM